MGYFSPLTRTVQAASSLARGALADVGVNVPAGGWIMEGWIRERLGLPRNLTWDPYRTDRMIANMAAEGKFTQREWEDLMVLGEAHPRYEEAKQRAGMESGVSRLTSGLVGLRTMIYPRGEQLQRQWKQDLYQLYEDQVRAHGGEPGQMTPYEQLLWLRHRGLTEEGTAVQQFYETHEAYGARQMLFKTEEERRENVETGRWWDANRALARQFRERIAKYGIGAPIPEEEYEWRDQRQALIDARFPNAVKETRPQVMEAPAKAEERVFSDRMERLLKEFPDFGDFEDSDEWNERTDEVELLVAEIARTEWPQRFYDKYKWWATPEGIEAYRARRSNNPQVAANYVYRKLYRDPYWREARVAAVSPDNRPVDWENVNPTYSQWGQLLDKYATEYNLDARILAAIMRVESQGKATAYNWESKATGLMQVMPASVIPGRPTIRDLQDPETNIKWGAMILSENMKATDYNMKDAVYRYSGGSAWQTRERFEEVYWTKLKRAYKALWGENLGAVTQDRKEQVWSQIQKPTIEELIQAILADPIYADKGWTQESLHEALDGTEVVTALTSWELRQPEAAEEQDLANRANTLLYEMSPPGIYAKQLSALPEVAAWRDSGTNALDAIAAISEYMQENPPPGTPEEWAEARRLNDAVLRRQVDQFFGEGIYDEQNAYFAAKDSGQKPQPSDRLAAYWDFLHAFEAENPVWARYYRDREAPPSGQSSTQWQRRGWSRGGGGGRGSDRGRPSWMDIANALGPTGAQELTAFFGTNAQPSGVTLTLLLQLMEQYGFEDWQQWLDFLKTLYQGAFGGALGEIPRAPYGAVRTVRRRY
jgi:hypothetical protein